MKHLINWLLPILFAVSAVNAQTVYRKSQLADGTKINRVDGTPGTFRFDQKFTGTLPSNAVPWKGGSRFQYPYAPSTKGVINAPQFGSGLYYSNTYKFSVDFPGIGAYSPDQRKLWGINKFTYWSVKPEHRSQLKFGDGWHYWTENGLGDYMRSYGNFFMTDLQTFVNNAWDHVPAMGYGDFEAYDTWIMNIEQLNFFDPGPKSGPPLPGYSGNGYAPDWDSFKDRTIQMESSPEKITVAQLAARGYDAWYSEFRVRRANRYVLLQLIFKEKTKPGTKVSYGSPRYTPFPYTQWENSNDAFIDSFCKVQYCGGNPDGYITLQKPGGASWTVRLNTDVYGVEDVNDLYYYPGNMDMDQSDYNDIFYAHKDGTQTAEYLWSKVKPIHIVGIEKAIHQYQQNRMMLRDGKLRPIFRQIQLFYEADYYWPFSDVYGSKVYYPPYEHYARFVVSRFLAGNTEGWGFYIFPTHFPDLTVDIKNNADPNINKYYNFAQHTAETLLQARRDMQPYEIWYTGSTLVENPEIKINQTGDWVAPTGGQAVNNTYGVQGPSKPAYIMRHKPVQGGWNVVIVGGMLQNWTDERTDLVRVPGGALTGAQFRVKLRGPGVHIYEFFVASSDSNQTYDALPTAITSQERAGYSGWILNNN